ncbi:MAG: phage tail tape measure protein [bacterium]|nr:phage tail tape measure protein [bacterium]
MADKVASLYGELTLDDKLTPGLKKAEGGLTSFGSKLEAAGQRVADFGAGMVKITAPFVAGIGLAITAAVGFDEQITNVASVMGLTAEQSRAMGDAMIEISQTTKFSATEMAGAMYDVVGGVADASAHMDILAASALLAEGSNADLVASTNALISSYNAYGDTGVTAARVSDVLTAAVRDGVGTMDELAAKFGTTATLAAPLGVDIEELGLLFAELSKKGATFNESGTRIEAALSALINPTKELETAFEQMGMTQADVLTMLENEGLTAVIKKMTDAGVDLTAVFGDKEALLGVLAIADIDSTRAAEFTTSLEGATVAARDIQAAGAKFKWDTLVGDFSDLAVVAGEALLPAFSGLAAELSPVVQDFAEWAKENPQLIQDIAKVALIAAGLGLVLGPLGTILGVVGAGIGIVSTGLGAIVAVSTGVISAIGGILAAALPIAAPFLAAAAAIGGFVAGLDDIRKRSAASGPMTYNFGSEAEAIAAAAPLIQAQNNANNRGVSNPITGGVNPIFAGMTAPSNSRGITPRTGRAEGGDVVAGGLYEVGERGKEWFMPNVGGRVFNQRQAKGIGGMNITGGTFVFNGVNNVQQLYDELTKVGMQRGQ